MRLDTSSDFGGFFSWYLKAVLQQTYQTVVAFLILAFIHRVHITDEYLSKISVLIFCERTNNYPKNVVVILILRYLVKIS